MLAHVPGIETADYEIVQVDHDVDALADRCSTGAKVVCNTVGPCIYYGSTVAEAALKARLPLHRHGRRDARGCRLAKEQWGAKFEEAGLLLAPATAYMSAVAEACARIAIERSPGIDSLEILSMFMGFPDLRVDADDLRAAAVGVDLPRAERVQGVAAGDDARGDDPERRSRPSSRCPGAASRIRCGSRTTRRSRTCARSAACSTARSWRASSRASATTRRRSSRCRRRSSGKCSPGSPTRCSPASRRARTGACSARSTSSSDAATSRSVQVSAHGQGAYLQTGLIQAFAAHQLVHQPPRKVGFASPGEAFGHREILAALEAYGFVQGRRRLAVLTPSGRQTAAPATPPPQLRCAARRRAPQRTRRPPASLRPAASACTRLPREQSVEQRLAEHRRDLGSNRAPRRPRLQRRRCSRARLQRCPS